MKKLLVFAGSSSNTSINKALATWAAEQMPDVSKEILDLNDYEMPIYSSQREKDRGIPDRARDFLKKIEEADGLIVSLAEHNGSYSAAFKNIMDWASRAKSNLWSDKPVFLMSTSPGKRGGASVRSAAEAYWPHLGAQIKASFSLPEFYENFKSGVTDSSLKEQFDEALKKFLS